MRKAVRSRPFHRVLSWTSNARPRPNPINRTVASTVYFSVKRMELTKNRFWNTFW